jgi:type VI secretion system protein ImpA
MSRKNASPSEARDVAAKAAGSHDWLAPVGDLEPCGPDLEYDHDFVVLFSAAAPRRDAQYGAFVGAPDPLNWSEIERDCRRLMMRCRDMRVAVLFARCRTQLAGAVGFAEGIALLAAWLRNWPNEIHPQPGVDADRDAALEIRMNALQALTDGEGLLGDLREIVLTKSTATRLQVRDVERAFSHPRPVDAPAADSVVQQLRDLCGQQPATMAAFGGALTSLAAIDAWCAEHLNVHAPDLSPLIRLLRHLAVEEPHQAEATSPPAPVPTDAAEPAGPLSADVPLPGDAQHPVAQPHALRDSAAPADRQAALALIRSARQWFDTHEPSSPIPVLLKRAEQFVGKRYAEIVQAIPAELLIEWEKADDA